MDNPCFHFDRFILIVNAYLIIELVKELPRRFSKNLMLLV